MRTTDPHCAETTPQVADRFAAGCGVIDNTENNNINNNEQGRLLGGSSVRICGQKADLGQQMAGENHGKVYRRGCFSGRKV